SHSAAPDFRAQTAQKKITKQRMQAIFFAHISFADDRQKNVFLGKLGQSRRTAHFGKKSAANVERQRFEKGKIKQKFLNFFRLARENFFGEVIENILFRLLQDFIQIER